MPRFTQKYLFLIILRYLSYFLAFRGFRGYLEGLKRSFQIRKLRIDVPDLLGVQQQQQQQQAYLFAYAEAAAFWIFLRGVRRALCEKYGNRNNTAFERRLKKRKKSEVEEDPLKASIG